MVGLFPLLKKKRGLFYVFRQLQSNLLLINNDGENKLLEKALYISKKDPEIMPKPQNISIFAHLSKNMTKAQGVKGIFHKNDVLYTKTRPLIRLMTSRESNSTSIGRFDPLNSGLIVCRPSTIVLVLASNRLIFIFLSFTNQKT